ncbi:MAG: phosphate ABC transporter permease subunit PstC, partial [Deltaproteobacteria bacterium CG_4_10_14_3_um_filter_60_8]
ILQAAQHYRNLRSVSRTALGITVLSLAIGGILLVWRRIKPSFRARNHVETVVRCILIVCSIIAILTTIGIVLSILYESIRFFKEVPLSDFLFGLEWSPQTAIRKDQVGSSGAFGAIPVLLGTALISAIAMVVAVPVGLMSAIYLSEYAGSRFRAAVKPLIEILAGIP